MLDHIAFDVFDHHDRIVHHDANGQYQAEQRELIDRKAKRQHASEGADQRHEDGDDADEGGAQVLKEQVDHQDHQHDGFKQCVEDLLDRQANEVGRVEGDHIVDTCRHRLFEIFHRLAHRLRDIEAVGTWLLIDRNRCGRHAVEAVVVDIGAAPGFGAGDILEANDGAAVGIGAQDDVFVFSRIDEGRLGQHRKVQIDLPGGRLLIDLPCADHRVLTRDRGLDVGGGDAE